MFYFWLLTCIYVPISLSNLFFTLHIISCLDARTLFYEFPGIINLNYATVGSDSNPGRRTSCSWHGRHEWSVCQGNVMPTSFSISAYRTIQMFIQPSSSFNSFLAKEPVSYFMFLSMFTRIPCPVTFTLQWIQWTPKPVSCTNMMDMINLVTPVPFYVTYSSFSPSFSQCLSNVFVLYRW